MLGSNELSEAVNVEYSPETGGLVTRGGLLKTAGLGHPVLNEIADMAEIPGLGVLIQSVSSNLFYFREMLLLSLDLSEIMAEGKFRVIGAQPFHTTLWDDGRVVFAGRADNGDIPARLCWFDGRGAVGGIKWVGTPEAPENPRRLFVRNGRLGCVEGDSTLRFSGVGDMEQWENDPDDLSTAQFVEVGYKDGMSVTAVVPLSRDLIVFKCREGDTKHGIIYRVVGDFPDLSVVEAARNTGTFSQRSVQIVGNDIFYLSEEGLCTLSTVTSYGDVKMAWPDAKVNNVLKTELRPNCELVNFRERGQLWVWPERSYPATLYFSTAGETADDSVLELDRIRNKKVWVMHYNKGGAWTKFDFPEAPYGIAGGLIGISSDLYSLNDWYQQDTVSDTDRTIKAKIGLGVLAGKLQTLAKFAVAGYRSAPNCKAFLHIGEKLKIPLSVEVLDEDIAFSDYDIAFLDDDPLVYGFGSLTTARKRCLARGWSIPAWVEIEGGGFILSSVGIETVEV
jgi:hypothetical protein